MHESDHPMPDNDAEIEFTDLDNPTHGRTFRELRFSRRTRGWMIAVTIVSVVLFISLTFGSQLYAIIYKPQPPKITIKSSPASITLQTVADGVVYAVDPDRMFYAIRTSNGSLIWNSFHPDINQSLVSNGVTYNVLESGALIVAQGKEVPPLWVYHLPSRSSKALTIVDKHLYVVTQDNTIYALNAGNGALLWHVKARSQISESLLVSGGFIYIISDSGVISTLRASDGSFLWHQQISSYAQVLAINESIVYVNNNVITALHAKNGSLAWKFHLSVNPVQPLVTAYGNIYVAGFDNTVSAFNANTGSLLWRQRLPALAYEPVVVSNTMVYIHDTDNSMYALSASGGSLLWSKPVANVLSFVVVAGTAYIVTLNNKVEAIDKAGITLWQRQISSSPIRPLLVSNGVVYTGSASGTVYAFRASDSTLLWHYATQAP